MSDKPRLAPVGRTRAKLTPGSAIGFGPIPETQEPPAGPSATEAFQTVGESVADIPSVVAPALPAAVEALPAPVTTAPAPATAPTKRRRAASPAVPVAAAPRGLTRKRTLSISDDVLDSVEISMGEFSRSHREHFRAVGRPTDSGFIEMLMVLGLKHINDEEALSFLPADGRKTRFQKPESVN